MDQGDLGPIGLGGQPLLVIANVALPGVIGLPAVRAVMVYGLENLDG